MKQNWHKSEFSLTHTHRISPKKNAAGDLCDDYYPTPPWVTRVLIHSLKRLQEQFCFAEFIKPSHHVLEPAAGNGHMAKPLKEYFKQVTSLDIVQRQYPLDDVVDFLSLNIIDRHALNYDWIITNPPFNVALEFVEYMRMCKPSKGVCVLVPINFLRSEKRYNALLQINPPHFVINFAERINIRQNRCQKNGSSAAHYVWCVWLGAEYATGNNGISHMIYLPPHLKKSHEREHDYD